MKGVFDWTGEVGVHHCISLEPPDIRAVISDMRLLSTPSGTTKPASILLSQFGTVRIRLLLFTLSPMSLLDPLIRYAILFSSIFSCLPYFVV